MVGQDLQIYSAGWELFIFWKIKVHKKKNYSISLKTWFRMSEPGQK